MISRRRCSTLATIVATVGALACADALSPGRTPDVIPNPGGRTAKDSTPSPASDTTLASNRLRGMVIATSIDSTATWRPVESVRLEAAQRDPRTGAMTVLATATSDASGRFVFEPLDVPTGLVFIRAVPASGSGFRASRWLAAYSFVGSWFTIGRVGPGGQLVDGWRLGPYLVLEPLTVPERDYAPVLLIAHVLGGTSGDRDIPVPAARVVVNRGVPNGDNTAPTPGEIVASGRADANGFALISLPGPGLYVSRVTMPPESPYADVPYAGGSSTPADGDATRVIVWEYAGIRR